MKKSLCLVPVLLACGAFGLHAEEMEPSPDDAQTNQSSPQAELFDQLDMNGDGVVDEEEARYSLQLEEQFDELDTDDDGDLEMAEFREFETDSNFGG